MRTRARAAARAASIATAALLGACASDGQRDAPTGSGVRTPAPSVVRAPSMPARGEAPGAASLIRAHNTRVAALSRLWSRATTEIFYTNSEGERRWEQGEGHFQFVAPARMALTVRKLGETVLYLGCDAERHWLFEPAGADRVSIGRNDNAGNPCARSLGLPANPLDLIDLLGLSPLAEGAASTVAVSGDGRLVMLSQPARSGVICHTFDARTLEPVRIELLAPPSPGAPPAVLVSAELTAYETITLRGSGVVPPRLPTRVSLRHAETGTEIRLHLADATNGRPEQLPDEAFDFDSLVESIGPVRALVLDRDCPTPALAPAWLAERGIEAR